MDIAFLFNADHPMLEGLYSFAVMSRILSSNVLQPSDRNIRISTGDILTYSVVAQSPTPTTAKLVSVCRKLYRPDELDLLIPDRLRATHGKATVFCWLFQNMTADIGRSLHSELVRDPAYLGAMDVNFSVPLHLQFFRNSLPERYRVRGRSCSVFYSMRENEYPDTAIHSVFEENGFNVSYEDIGARRTLFDNYDTIDHFRRVQDFKKVFAQLNGLSSDQVSNLVVSLEELHPKLLEVLAAISRTLERAETEEDFAQVALSGRRLLEKTADYLFPPRDEQWNGRDVGRTQYKNRLWAYIEKTIREAGIEDATVLSSVGKEADRLIALFNAGLHAEPMKKDTEEAFRDLVVWLTRVIELSPSHARRPYLAYEKEFLAFMREVVSSHPAESPSLRNHRSEN